MSQALRNLAGSLDEALRPLRNRHYLVLPRRRLAYGRVPKAANSSVKRALFQLEWPKRDVDRVGKKVNRDEYWADKDPARARLATASQLSQFPDLLVFAVVRSPFARLLSCYRDKFEGRSELHPAFAYTGFRLDMSFREFALHACTVGDLFANNHMRSQFDILSHRGVLVPEVVCRVEWLERDWQKLTRRLRQHTGRRLPPLDHRNRAPDARPLAQAYADRDVVRAVRRRFEADFETFYPRLPDP